MTLLLIFNARFQRFTIVSWNVGLEEDFWKRPEVWCRHDTHIPRKMLNFKSCLKISMCSSAFHSRSTLPSPINPHTLMGISPIPEVFYYISSLLYFLWWVIDTGFRWLAENDKLNENKRPELWRQNVSLVYILMRTPLDSPSLSSLASRASLLKIHTIKINLKGLNNNNNKSGYCLSFCLPDYAKHLMHIISFTVTTILWGR